MNKLPPTADQIRQARALQGNQVLTVALDQVEKDAILAWKAESDAAKREVFWSRVQAVTLIRSEIDATIKRTLRDEREQPSE